jgi:hypothetical protein
MIIMVLFLVEIQLYKVLQFKEKIFSFLYFGTKEIIWLQYILLQ